MMHINIAERFQTPEYQTFKDFAKKSAAESSISVINNKIVYGKVKVDIPFFRNVESIKTELQEKRTKLYLEYNDLYETIVICDEPILYKKRYQTIIDSIEQVDRVIDEIDAYVNSVNEQRSVLPISSIQQQIETNKSNVQYAMNSMKDDVHVAVKSAKQLLSYHKKGNNLEQELKEAKDISPLDYIIWDEPSIDLKDLKARASKGREPVRVTSSKKLSAAKKAIIKKATKKVMVDKLT
jgi:hypothetical protein